MTTHALRHYQSTAIKAVWEHLAESDGHTIGVLPTGTGKSLVIAEFIRRALTEYPSTRILILQHVRELILQNMAELLCHWPNAPVGVYSAGMKRKDRRAQVLFASIQSIHRKAFDFQDPPFDLVLVDECFPAGTEISSPSGPISIEDVRPGDRVINAAGIGTVEAVSERFTKSLVEVELDDGSRFQCTDNHPIFTPEGFIKAGELEIGRRLFRSQDVRQLWNTLSPLDKERRCRECHLCDEAGTLGKTAFLLNILLKDCRECDADRRGAGENVTHASFNWPSPNHSGRQWNWPDCAAEHGNGDPWLRMVGRICGPYQDETRGRVSDLLQTRYCQSIVDDRNRIGRTNALRNSCRSGCEEGCPFGGVRVARVSRIECKGDTRVFNLQVSGHPSYFANGVLVHNCHLIPRSSNTTYRKFLDDLKQINPYIRVIGWTATAFRTDSGMLHKGDDAIFSSIAYEYNVRDAIAEGYLCQPVTKASAVQIDTSHVGTRAGEFIPGQLEAAATDPATVQAVAGEIVRHGGDRKGWLFFGCGIEHCKMMRDALRERGISCECIFGDTPTAERDRIIAAYKRQEIRCLSAMNVLLIGFNAPHSDLLAMGRPTKSTGLWIQAVGRVLRLHPGKQDALVLCFGGNVARHGPIDRPFVKGEWRDGPPGEAPTKTCPMCETPNPLSATECLECGYKFPPAVTKIDTKASGGALLTTQIKPEFVEVTHAVYRRHEKTGKPPTLRVDYLCGLTTHSEWICFEHVGYPRQKACEWWIKRAPGRPVPMTVDDALAQVTQLLVPHTIQVKQVGKFHEIVSARFN
jgi:DNA repair protein RadD